MPHYALATNDDGSVRQILRDGESYDQAIRLEPAWSIVSTYFKLARGNLGPMARASDVEMRRFHGLQAFLMSLTGVEAFTNVFFRLHGENTGNSSLLDRVGERGPLVPRLRACLNLAFARSLDDQDVLLGQVRELYQLRNQIVHPQWDPASLSMDGAIVIHGLAQNFQAAFEDDVFCLEAFCWCLLLVVRVGKLAGNTDTGFAFHWTGQYGLTEEYLLERLGLTTPR